MAAATAISGGQEDRIKEARRFDETKMGVKGLSDSGITSIPNIFVHPPDTLADLKKKKHDQHHKTPVSIPVIDLFNVTSATHRPQIVSQVKEAASTWGFFQVINHGVPLEVIDSTIKAIKSFHEQPHEVKSKYYKRQEEKGVSFSSNNDLYRAKAASWHDYLQVCMGPDPVNPEELPEACRDEVLTWDVHSKNVADIVFELLAEGLGLEARKFKESTFSESRALEGIYYPYCPEPDLTVGLTPHTDPASLTVLVQNDVGGLQVKHEEHGWVDVMPIRGGLIINVGDFLQIVSNDEYNSVQQRVLANSSKEPRISVVEFFNLSKWGECDNYGPLTELLSPDKPAIYRNFTKQEFHGNFYSKGLDSKSFPQKIKISN